MPDDPLPPTPDNDGSQNSETPQGDNQNPPQPPLTPEQEVQLRFLRGQRVTIPIYNPATARNEPDPFPITTYNWQDGFRIKYQESWRRNQAQIAFGDQHGPANPLTIEQIQPLLTAEGYQWDGEVAAWTKRLMSDHTRSARANNKYTRQTAEQFLEEIVRIEEQVRGPVGGQDGPRQVDSPAR